MYQSFTDELKRDVNSDLRYIHLQHCNKAAIRFVQVIPDTNTTLVLSLHHPQAQMREFAVKRLGDLLEGKEVKRIN